MIEPATPRETPPGGWRWVHPETKHTLSGGTFDELVVAARRFMGNNNYPVPRDLADTILRWMDEQIQANMHARGLPPYPLISTTEKPSLINMARRFAYEAAVWARSGAKHVTQEQYETRLESCETCHFWQGQAAFGYGRCGKCGCSGLKLWMTTTRCPLDPPRWSAVG